MTRDPLDDRDALLREASARLDALAEGLQVLAGAAFAVTFELGPDVDGARDETPPAPLDDAQTRCLEALPQQVEGVMPWLVRDAEIRRTARAHGRLVDALRTLDAHLRRRDPRYDDVPHERSFGGPAVRRVYALREVVEMLEDEAVLVVDLPSGEVTRHRARALRSNFELMTALEGPDPALEDDLLRARYAYFTWRALARDGAGFTAERLEHRLWGDDRPRDIPRFEGVAVVLRARASTPARCWRTWVVKPLDASLRGGLALDAPRARDEASGLLARMADAARALDGEDRDDPFDRALRASTAPRSFLLPTGCEGAAHCHFGVPAGLDYAGRLFNGYRPLTAMPARATRIFFDDVKRQAALLEAFLASRYASAVERLVVGTTSHVTDEELHGDDDAYHTHDFDAVIALLAGAKLPFLKRLELGAHERHHNADLDLVGSLGDLTPVLRALAHVEELRLYGRFELSEAVSLPALRRLDVVVADQESNRGPLSNETLHRLLASDAPALTDASLRLDGLFDDEVPQYTFPPAFLEGGGVPSLRAMSVRGAFSRDEARRLREGAVSRRARIELVRTGDDADRAETPGVVSSKSD